MIKKILKKIKMLIYIHIFKINNKKFYTEQEIIDAGLEVIYRYCFNVNGRWIDIEHLMIEDAEYGYLYAKYVIEGRYDTELETLYLMRHSGGYYVKWYISELVDA